MGALAEADEDAGSTDTSRDLRKEHVGDGREEVMGTQPPAAADRHPDSGEALHHQVRDATPLPRLCRVLEARMCLMHCRVCLCGSSSTKPRACVVRVHALSACMRCPRACVVRMARQGGVA